MMCYVCPVHEDEVLFSSDTDSTAGAVGKRLSVIPLLSKEMPRACHRCNIFYYRHECIEKEV